MLQRMLRQWKSQRKVPNFLPKVSWFPGSQWHWPGLVPSVRAQTTQLFFVIYRPAFAQPQDASRRLHRRTRSSFPSVGAGTAEFAWCLWQDLTVIYFWESNLFAAWLVPPFGNPTFLEIKPFWESNLFGNPIVLYQLSNCPCCRTLLHRSTIGLITRRQFEMLKEHLESMSLQLWVNGCMVQRLWYQRLQNLFIGETKPYIPIP